MYYGRIPFSKKNECIIGVATRVKHQVLYVRVARILNVRSDVKIYDEIKVTYECVIIIT